MNRKFNDETIEASSFILSKVFKKPEIHAILFIDMTGVFFTYRMYFWYM